MNIQVDLLPGGYRARDIIKERLLRWILVVCICVVVIAAGGFLLKWQTVKLGTRVNELRANVAGMRSWEKMILPLAANLENVGKQRTIVNELLSEPYWSGLLAEVAAAAPEGLLLDSLEVTRYNRPAELNEEGSSLLTVMLLAGSADSNARVFQFVKALSGSGQLRRVTLRRSTVTEGQTGPGTTLTFEIRGIVNAATAAGPSIRSPSHQ